MIAQRRRAARRDRSRGAAFIEFALAVPLLMVFGMGIVEMPHTERVTVALVVCLSDQVERMPTEDATRTIAGIAVPSIMLAGHEASAPIKVGLALTRLAD